MPIVSFLPSMCHCEEPDSIFPLTSIEVLEGCSWAFLKRSLLQPGQALMLQSFLTGRVLLDPSVLVALFINFFFLFYQSGLCKFLHQNYSILKLQRFRRVWRDYFYYYISPFCEGFIGQVDLESLLWAGIVQSIPVRLQHWDVYVCIYVRVYITLKIMISFSFFCAS